MNLKPSLLIHWLVDIVIIIAKSFRLRRTRRSSDIEFSKNALMEIVQRSVSSYAKSCGGISSMDSYSNA